MNEQYFSYLFIFSKVGILRFISHLDLMRLFQRVLRRAEIPVVFSKGFHPHPKIKFERALKLGVESREEKLYFKLLLPLSPDELMQRFNAQLPKGVQIISACRA
ncbi:MAG: TIGR03936 family radical SAM-associated protein [Candidatus Saelkia tenebricola]|nr:TIGR03936 family radical SAM-associated protein [Candidatus Saelkia tenebricola]